MAWVKIRSEEAVDEATLTAFCKGRIATYKIPRYWKLVGEFPLTVTGKVQKFRMREQSIIEVGLAQAAATKTA